MKRSVLGISFLLLSANLIKTANLGGFQIAAAQTENPDTITKAGQRLVTSDSIVKAGEGGPARRLHH